MSDIGGARSQGSSFPARAQARIVAGASALLALAAPAWGIINARYTPVHLVSQSQTILAGTLRKTPGTGDWTLAVAEVIKGDANSPAKQGALSLGSFPKDQAEDLEALLAQNAKDPVILFDSVGRKKDKVFLHVSGVWVALKAAGERRWDAESFDKSMSGVYAGGTDMLVRMSRYIAADSNATVPVSAGVIWMNRKCKIGQVRGEIAGMEALELAADGRMYLFVGSGEGDALFRAKQKDEAFEDLTPASRLDTRSRQFAWVDLDRDGLAELVSWDGNEIAVRQFTRDGTFKPLGAPLRSGAECLGISACSAPGKASCAILISTAGLPVLAWREKDGRWTSQSLPDGNAVAQAGRSAGPCIVADLDNDGYWDVLQPRDKGGVLWMGKSDGLAPPAPSPVCCPEERCRFTLGDFDQDGFLDIFLCGPTKAELWENDGKGGFRPVIARAGSLDYKLPTGLSSCRTADLNHDGRQDLCLLSLQGEFTFHFNRGFRCFGEEGELRLGGAGPDDPPSAGQKACAIADFNGDASLDLAVAMADGAVYCYYNDCFNKPILRVGLKPPLPGPVTASVWQGDSLALCMGTLSISGPAPKAYFCPRQGGQCTIRWSAPGKGLLTRKVKLPDDLPPNGLEVLLEP